MDKRYQVFVSSTYEDLREERAEVIQALLELDCIPSGMELFPAGDEEQWTVIQRIIDDCDYYIVVIAGRYGSAGPDGKSYTQMEYEYAVSQHKPVMAFLHEHPGNILQSKAEQDPGQRASLDLFRDLAKKKMCKYWNSPKELAGVVSRAVAKMKQDRPGVGWVRANLVMDEGGASEMLRLRNENDELRRRLEVAESEPPKGSEAFAQGSERTELNFRHEGQRGEIQSALFATTWDEIFSVIAPVMIDGASDSDLKNKLAEMFTNRQSDKTGVRVFRAYIRDEDYQQVKLQFRALGMIVRDDRPIHGQDGKTYWILTPYGDTMLTQIAAARTRVPPGVRKG